MTRYIDAEKLQEEFKELHGGKRSLLIDTAPTADVVEVVRCKDCKNYQLSKNGCNGLCERNYASFTADDFCSFGERESE